ncbi:MAG: hypothetical protein ABI775_08300 [Pseudonocardiales bacterium]|nr:hypothetical protein [Actinomycetota bacterium]
MTAQPPVRRVRITHPRTEAVRRVPTRPASREIDEQTQVGTVYMDSLIRSQRRLAVMVCLTVTAMLMGTALLGAMVPRFARLHLLGVPLPWVVLGALVYPALIALAAYTVRKAERNERAFTQLVRHR